jgi:DNA-binding NtrC family response regulator
MKLELPPLRERKEDIPLLAEHFIAQFNTLQGREVTGIAKEALACLMAHDYPGNIRELENIVERALILCHSGQIEQAHILPSLCPSLSPDSLAKPDPDSFKQVEAAFLMNALRQNDWSRLKTARQLGIHKTTLFRKMKSLGLEAPPAGKPS